MEKETAQIISILFREHAAVREMQVCLMRLLHREREETLVVLRTASDATLEAAGIPDPAERREFLDVVWSRFHSSARSKDSKSDLARLETKHDQFLATMERFASVIESGSAG